MFFFLNVVVLITNKAGLSSGVPEHFIQVLLQLPKPKAWKILSGVGKNLFKEM